MTETKKTVAKKQTKKPIKKPIKKPAPAKKRGRPVGSKNKPKPTQHHNVKQSVDCKCTRTKVKQTRRAPTKKTQVPSVIYQQAPQQFDTSNIANQINRQSIMLENQLKKSLRANEKTEEQKAKSLIEHFTTNEQEILATQHLDNEEQRAKTDISSGGGVPMSRQQAQEYAIARGAMDIAQQQQQPIAEATPISVAEATAKQRKPRAPNRSPEEIAHEKQLAAEKAKERAEKATPGMKKIMKSMAGQKNK
jgi:hypothetical protein